MPSDWVYVGDLERAIASNLLSILRTAAHHRLPDRSFCTGVLLTGRANTISCRCEWTAVSDIVRAALDGETELLGMLQSTELLEG